MINIKDYKSEPIYKHITLISSQFALFMIKPNSFSLVWNLFWLMIYTVHQYWNYERFVKYEQTSLFRFNETNNNLTICVVSQLVTIYYLLSNKLYVSSLLISLSLCFRMCYMF